MTMTDPIADMLTRLRNANQAYHDVVSMPYSKMKAGLAEILKQEGYITSYDVADNVTAEGEPSVGKTPHQQARPARLRQEHQPAQGPRWPRRRDHLDVAGTADRPPGEPEGRGRRSPRLRLVTRTI